jgi:UDP-2,3-diacylglucosamine pyrophosphatase LpxH
MITRYFRRIAIAGDTAYQALLRANVAINHVRARLDKPQWSLSAYAKHQVKRAVNFVSAFEDAVARDCRQRGLDGVICGHIHHAEIRRIHGVQYYNCGDWMESCTALTEDANGRFEIVCWDPPHARERASPKVTPLEPVLRAGRKA